jgi:hypothetical protein
MTPLDLLDQSFLRHRPAAFDSAAVMVEPHPAAVLAAAATADPPCPHPEPAAPPETAEASTAVVDPVLGRLLVHAPQAWRQVADCVEEAHARGRRSIAVTGARRGEGRSTLVQGLAHLLRERGLKVECVGLAELGLGWDDALTLVDGGIWFPPGPLRRQVLEQRSVGCDAVIIVRRADQSPCPARGAAVESIGLELLGEVVTFAPSDQPLY